jgi:hypothetical protein
MNICRNDDAHGHQNVPQHVRRALVDLKMTFSIAFHERVDPGPGHDDLCNSAAIALLLANNKRRAFEPPAPARAPL